MGLLSALSGMGQLTNSEYARLQQQGQQWTPPQSPPSMGLGPVSNNEMMQMQRQPPYPPQAQGMGPVTNAEMQALMQPPHPGQFQGMGPITNADLQRMLAGRRKRASWKRSPASWMRGNSMLAFAIAILMWLSGSAPPKSDLCQHRYEQSVREARSPVCPSN